MGNEGRAGASAVLVPLVPMIVIMVLLVAPFGRLLRHARRSGRWVLLLPPPAGRLAMRRHRRKECSASRGDCDISRVDWAAGGLMLDKDDPWLREVSDRDVVDPLTPVARKDRNALLVCNLLVFAVFQINIVPRQLSFSGVSTNEFDPGAVKILVLVLLAYFVCAFTAAIGAEYQAWKSNLDALWERRQLRAEYYLEQSAAKAEAMHREKFPHDTPEMRSDLRAQQVAHFNHIQQKAWSEYRKGYQRRMIFDGYVPLALSLLNGAAALLTYVI